MNTYTTEFFATCPNNGIRIKYHLRIESQVVIAIEQIIAAIEIIEEGFHEEIADDLLVRFGGVQTLAADHHGVTIETTRGRAMSVAEATAAREADGWMNDKRRVAA